MTEIPSEPLFITCRPDLISHWANHLTLAMVLLNTEALIALNLMLILTYIMTLPKIALFVCSATTENARIRLFILNMVDMHHGLQKTGHGHSLIIIMVQVILT